MQQLSDQYRNISNLDRDGGQGFHPFINTINELRIGNQISLNPSDVGREKIMLAGVSLKVVGSASFIAEKLQTEWSKTTKLYKKLQGKHSNTLLKEIDDLTEKNGNKELIDRLLWCILEKSGKGEGVRLANRQTTYDKLKISLNKFLERYSLNEFIGDEQFLAVATYFCVSNKENKKGFLLKFPDGFVDLKSESGVNRFESLVRFLIVNKLELDSVKSLENIRDLKKSLSNYVSPSVFRKLSPRAIIELAYNDFTNGADPIVRPWLIYDVNKWKGTNGATLARHACSWILEIRAKVYDRESNTFDTDKIETINWRELFHKEGLAKMLEYSEVANTTYKAIELGAKELSGNEIFGFAENQVLPWKIKRTGMWSVKGKKECLIDSVTKYVVNQVLRKKKPEMFSKNGKGALLPRAVVAFGGWSKIYNEVACDCLRGAKLHPLEAIQRVYPEIFGINGDFIKPWEISNKGIRQGRKGYKIFRQQTAYALGKAGFGSFDYEGDNLVWKLHRQDLSNWYSKKSKDKPTLSYVMTSTEFGMSSAFRNVSTKGVFHAFSILLSLRKTSNLPFKSPTSSQHVRKNLEYVFSEIYPEGVKINVGKKAPFRFTKDRLDKINDFLLKPFPNVYYSRLEVLPVLRNDLIRTINREKHIYKNVHEVIIESSFTDEQQFDRMYCLAFYKENSGYLFNDNDLKELINSIKTSVMPLISCESDELLKFCEKFLNIMEKIPTKNLRAIIQDYLKSDKEQKSGVCSIDLLNELLEIAISFYYKTLV